MIKIQTRADLALFERPEMSVDKCSYDMITISAARGLLECVYWHPGMIWKIDRIFILNPIRFVNIGVHKERSIMALRDVNYIVEAHFEMTEAAAASDNVGKISDIIKRRLKKKDFYTAPYLGSKEYPASIEPYTSRNIQTAYKGVLDLGYMLYDFEYSTSAAIPMYFRAILQSGVLDVKKCTQILK